ncbi:FAD/NAD(P)-binding protein [Corynebacterium yudongzhengii]|uniref:FAD/NAD(P)-binding protein n=1 Tax=Corynebacterium yudongzhengii TaxID=2080740 RepID=UPI001FA83A0D|nr:FAD/NAD(P)-binding protein [Corynebacterium yudongzhengii]
MAFVGVGPRGISTLERLAAHAERTDHHLTVHLIDDTEIGPGAIWRTDQTRTLCMNTLAHGVTLFTEPGSSVSGAVQPGPTLYEWAKLMRGDLDEVPADHRLAVSKKTYEEFKEEIDGLVEHSHPTRALYGAYISWVYSVVRERLPENLTVVEHLARVTDLVDRGDYDELTLTDSAGATSTLQVDRSVLALGWLQPAATAEEEALAASTGTWVRPGNPVEQPLDEVPAGEDVLVRGLGMGFFDIMAMLTLDRGGRFVPSDNEAGLIYEPSGREPRLIVTSGRGWPYLAKPQYGSMPPAAHMPRTRAAIAELSGRSDIDYDTEVWTHVLRDAYEAYYLTLGLDAETVAGVVDKHSTIDELNAAFAELVPDTERLDLNHEAAPLAGVATDIDSLTALVRQGLIDDLADSAAASESPRKQALAVIGAARKPSSLLGTPGRFRTRNGYLRLVQRLGQMAGSGPPAFRNEQLVALIDAGLVRFLGASPSLEIVDGGYRVSSPTTQNEPVFATTLIDAWLHDSDSRRPADSLITAIRAAGRSRPYVYPDDTASGSPEIEQATGRLITAAGTPDERIFAEGIPLHDVRPDTTSSPLPGTDPAFLQETDLVAGALVDTL